MQKPKEYIKPALIQNFINGDTSGSKGSISIQGDILRSKEHILGNDGTAYYTPIAFRLPNKTALININYRDYKGTTKFLQDSGYKVHPTGLPVISDNNQDIFWGKVERIDRVIDDVNRYLTGVPGAKRIIEALKLYRTHYEKWLRSRDFEPLLKVKEALWIIKDEIIPNKIPQEKERRIKILLQFRKQVHESLNSADNIISILQQIKDSEGK